MSDIPFLWADTWQEARDAHPDQPVALFRVNNNGVYMRYRGEFHRIDDRSYSYGVGGQRWRIAGVRFNPDSIAWMLNNSIEFPFTQEDLVLYQLTWGDVCE